MADNTQLSTNIGVGDVLATKDITHGGDASKLQAISIMGVSGTEGSYTIADINGTAANGLEVDVTRVQGTVTIQEAAAMDVSAATVTVDWAGTAPPIGAGVEATALRVTVATDSTGVLSVDDGGASLTIDNAAIDTVGGGTEAAAQRVTIANDSTGVLSVDDNGGSLTVDNAGLTELAAAINASELDINIASSNATVNVLTQASTNTIEVVGDVAHDIAAAGNPVLTAARATNAIAALTQVTTTDATYLTADLNGCLVTRSATTLKELISGQQTNTDGSEDAMTAFAAGGAGLHNYITDVTMANSNASTNGTVDLKDGAAGTVMWTFPVPATGGVTHHFNPPLKQATANTGLFFDPSAAITTISVSINGFQAQGS